MDFITRPSAHMNFAGVVEYIGFPYTPPITIGNTLAIYLANRLRPCPTVFGKEAKDVCLLLVLPTGLEGSRLAKRVILTVRTSRPRTPRGTTVNITNPMRGHDETLRGGGCDASVSHPDRATHHHEQQHNPRNNSNPPPLRQTATPGHRRWWWWQEGRTEGNWNSSGVILGTSIGTSIGDGIVSAGFLWRLEKIHGCSFK